MNCKRFLIGMIGTTIGSIIVGIVLLPVKTAIGIFIGISISNFIYEVIDCLINKCK